MSITKPDRQLFTVNLKRKEFIACCIACVTIIVAIPALTRSCPGGTLEITGGPPWGMTVTGDLAWIGAPTDDGEQTWPSSISVENISFDEGTADVSLFSEGPYTGSWTVSDIGMTSATSRFYSSTDGLASLELTMNPLGELTESTLSDITAAKFEWAEPTHNPLEAPVSWLSLDGSIAVPEAHPLAYVTLVAAVGFLLVLRCPRWKA